jgi:hypothetical protein
MRRLFIIIVPFLLLGGFVVFAQRVEVPTQPNQAIRPIIAPAAKQVPKPKRYREGTAFKDMLVEFRETGDRIVLYTIHDGQRFVCHENLALERTLTAIQEKPERKFWKIEGEYTEFRGENFVLIRRAVIAENPAVAALPSP